MAGEISPDNGLKRFILSKKKIFIELYLFSSRMRYNRPMILSLVRSNWNGPFIIWPFAHTLLFYSEKMPFGSIHTSIHPYIIVQQQCCLIFRIHPCSIELAGSRHLDCWSRITIWYLYYDMCVRPFVCLNLRFFFRKEISFALMRILSLMNDLLLLVHLMMKTMQMIHRKMDPTKKIHKIHLGPG